MMCNDSRKPDAVKTGLQFVMAPAGAPTHNCAPSSAKANSVLALLPDGQVKQASKDKVLVASMLAMMTSLKLQSVEWYHICAWFRCTD